MRARLDAFAALVEAIAGGSLDAAARRRLLRRIDVARKAERITALEARSLRDAVNGQVSREIMEVDHDGRRNDSQRDQ
jgi:hypothetical protein